MCICASGRRHHHFTQHIRRQETFAQETFACERKNFANRLACICVYVTEPKKSQPKQDVVLHTTYVFGSTIKLWCCVSFFGSGGKQFLVFCTYGTYCTIQLCGCVSFWFWREIGFGFTYLCTQSTIHTIVVLYLFFGSGGKQLLMLCTYLVYNTVVRLCQFFGCGGKQFSK